METFFDPEDYASRPDNLPPNSIIAQAMALGARFECKPEKQLWFAIHPMRVECGKTQVEAARAFLKSAE